LNRSRGQLWSAANLDRDGARQLVRRVRDEARDAGGGAERVAGVEPRQRSVNPFPQQGGDVLRGGEAVAGDDVGAGEEGVRLALEHGGGEEVEAEGARVDQVGVGLFEEAGGDDGDVEVAALHVLELPHVVAGVEDHLRDRAFTGRGVTRT
jgi:hypothetical protein